MNLGNDVRFALRRFAKGRLLTVAAVATLALAIGANTAIFSVIDSVLLQPLPYPDSDRLAAVWGSHPQIGLETASLPDFVDWNKRNEVFERMAAFARWGPTLTGSSEVRRLLGGRVTGDFFAVLKTEAVIGRTLSAEDDRPEAPKVVVLSHAFWRDAFSSSRDAVGAKLTLNGAPYEVVGVLPESFRHPAAGAERLDLWAPLALSETQMGRRGDFLRVIGRLQPGATWEAAQSNMDGVTSALSAEYPETNADWSAVVLPLKDEIVGSLRGALWLLFGAVALVLLVACGNVANLLLSGAADRVREFAVRAALGAGKWNLIRLFLLEGIVIGLAGGLAGLPVAFLGLRILKSLAPHDLPRLDAIQVHWGALAFTLAISLASGAAFGLFAGWRAATPRLRDALKEGTSRSGESRTARRVRESLVVAQMALALTLVFGAGLLFKSVSNLLSVDPGFDSKGLVTFSLSPPPNQDDEPGRVAGFYQSLMDRLRSLPPVESAGAVSALPLSEGGDYLAFVVEGRPPLPDNVVQDAQVVSITPDYLKTMKVPLTRGRPFDSRDHAKSAQVVLVNRAAVERYWPSEDPLGAKISFGPDTENPWMTIVGVVGDVKTESVDRETYPQIYRLQDQFPNRFMQVVLRADKDAAALAPDIRRLVRELDSQVPVQDIRSMEQLRFDSVSLPRFRSFLLGLFGFLALAMAAVGLYGVTAHSVTRRFQEMGVRLALGASSSRITWMVLRQGMKLAAIGVALGYAFSMLVNRALSGFLFGVGQTDVATFLPVALGLVLVALLACLAPALRASRIDPLEAIRYE